MRTDEFGFGGNKEMKKKEKDWEEELLELYRNRTTAWVDGNTMHDFIAKVRQEAFEEGFEHATKTRVAFRKALKEIEK